MYKTNDKKVNGKSLVYYKDIYPDRMIEKLPLKALISLNLDLEAVPSLKEMDMDKAFLDMISSTTLQNCSKSTIGQTRAVLGKDLAIQCKATLHKDVTKS